MSVFRAWVWACLALLTISFAAGCGRKVKTIDVLPKKVTLYGLSNTQRFTARLLDGNGQPIEEGSVVWSSSKGDVAAIDSGGRVTAKAEGQATITAQFQKVSATAVIEVLDVKTIEISPTTLLLVGPQGTRFPLRAVAKDSTGKPVKIKMQWSSLKPGIAAVDASGVVTTVAPGAAVILAKLGDLQAGSDVSVVLHDLTRLELRPMTAVVHPGEVQKFEVAGFGADGKSIEGLSTVFESSDTAVARVDPAGLASAVAPGAATIRSSIAGLTAEATLLVN
jgi:hypothetical protein